jgi:putative CocE/NonD family hydrolase
VYDPADPCPTCGGTLLLPRTYPAGPLDQRAMLERPDVLVFTSEPLERELEITGPVTAVLYAATSGPDTDWVVKLCELRPDGRTLNICDGIVRARFRAGDWTAPSLVEPDAVVRYEIDLATGHRLRVLVTSSDFPRYDRNPNTGDLGVEATVLRPARQRVFADAERPSHVVLPLVHDRAGARG